MSYIKADRVKESSTIVGTGTISLLGAAVGFRTFASQMSVGDTCSYVIANTTGSEWEVGIATYSSANTLTRTTVQSSTNANAVVNFSAGMKDVFISPTAQSVIDYNPITHQISNTNSIVVSPVASGVGNSLTITAGNGVGVGAGGNIVLAPGSQGSSGGDGKVIINNDANINELTIGKGVGQGYDSTAFGVEALNTNYMGMSNTALGYHTLKNNNMGAANTAVGSNALAFNNSGYYGTAIGAYALYVNTDGNQNTAVGAECLGSVTTGNNNVAIGAQAGANLVNGSNNILIGKTVYSPATSTSNFMTIGNLIFASGGFGTYNDIGTGNVGIGQASPTAKLHIVGASASTKGVIVQGASSQTANLQEWQNNNGTALTYINSSGSLFQNNINSTPVASGAGNNLTLSAGSGVGTGAGGSLVLQAGVQATSGGDGKVIVKQVAGQTSNLQEWQNSSGVVNCFVSATQFRGPNGGVVSGEGPGIAFNSYPNDGLGSNGSNIAIWQAGIIALNLTNTNKEFRIPSNYYYSWASSINNNTAADLVLNRDAADTLAQRRSTNPQAFRIYNTYTDASNYERLGITWATNICTIGLAQAGTGSTRNLVVAGANATSGAGGNVTITAGNGSGVGAGGNIILQPGAQGTSGGNGTTIIKASDGTNRIRAYDSGAVAITEFAATNGSAGLTVQVYTSGWSYINSNGVTRFTIDGTSNNILDMYSLSFNGVMYGYTSLAWVMNTPATFSTDQTDYLLAGNNAACKKIHRLATTNAAGNAIHSFKIYNGAWGGHELTIVNVGAYNLTIKHNSATGTSAWRMFNATGADIILGPNDKLDLMYDNVNNGSGAAGWRAW